METNERKTSMKAVAAAAALLAVGGTVAYAYLNKEEPADLAEGDNGQEGAVPQAGPDASGVRGSYRDGTYSATGNYLSPGGPEQVGVELTLTDGIITDIEFTSYAERPMSVQMQGQFAGGYKALVVGKSIDEVNLTKVSGSSLTPKGFNDAIMKIKTEAQAS